MKDLQTLTREFEAKLRRELLPFTNVAPQADGREAHKHDTVISVHLETEGEWPGNQFYQQLTSAIRSLDQKFDMPEQHLISDDADVQHDAFLLAICHSVQYNPILTWFAVDRDDEPDGGSVGRLARLDPVRGSRAGET